MKIIVQPKKKIQEVVDDDIEEEVEDY